MNSPISKLIAAISAVFLSLVVFSAWKNHGSDRERMGVQNGAVRQAIKKSQTYEKIIYTCQLDAETIPGVQIAEVKDLSGNTLGIMAHVYKQQEVHLYVEGAVPHWTENAISIQSADKNIKVINYPEKKNTAARRLLSLEGDGISWRGDVKNCSEVSDE